METKIEIMVMKNNIVILISCGLLALVLSGCSGKDSPDEFMVLKNAPLALPPDYHLTPDGPYSDLDDVLDPQEIAKRALFGES